VEPKRDHLDPKIDESMDDLTVLKVASLDDLVPADVVHLDALVAECPHTRSTQVSLLFCHVMRAMILNNAVCT